VEILVNLHSYWRYVVLVAAVVGLVWAFSGWLGSSASPRAVRLAGLIYTIPLDIQLLLGIILWVGESRWQVPGFYRFEHPSIMLLAVVAAHVGQVMARRSTDPKGAARTVAVAIAISLVLVVVGIPGVVRGA
jgi:hypothetical protein